MIVGIIVALCLIGMVCVIIPPLGGRPEPFRDENGKIAKGSLSEKLYVDINDTKLGMFIMARDETKPVLLLLGGGPGIPEYLLEEMYPSKLAEEFVVCYPEYRGTSLSYHTDTSADTMTTEQYLSDIDAITDYLCERFSKEQIYLLGHSFGSRLAIKTVQNHPERYIAYIAMSQTTDQRLSEELAYDYMYEQYRQAGNTKRMKQFEECPIKTSEEAYAQYFSSDLRDFAMHELGVGTTRDMDSVITGIFFPSLRCMAYTPMERINIWRGKAFAQKTQVGTSALDYNLFDEVKTLELPVYFFAGKYDYTCCYSLQKAFYEQLEAPVKQFYTFENSAHSPLFEEPDRAMEILREIVEKENVTSFE